MKKWKFLACLGIAVSLSACSNDIDTVDFCPDDDSKLVPGTCGCGTPDNDSDNNGIIDCLEDQIDIEKIDFCPTNPNKLKPDACGCDDEVEADNNENGIPDCLEKKIDPSKLDLCPDDENKTEPGYCGCGVPDTDANENGIIDCLEKDIDISKLDLCPDDENKTEPGYCGCGISEEIDPNFGIPKCLVGDLDLCPEDPAKTLPGKCGCGTPDSEENMQDRDGDGIINCLDPCPDDPTSYAPGAQCHWIVEKDQRILLIHSAKDLERLREEAQKLIPETEEGSLHWDAYSDQYYATCLDDKTMLAETSTVPYSRFQCDGGCTAGTNNTPATCKATCKTPATDIPSAAGECCDPHTFLPTCTKSGTALQCGLNGVLKEVTCEGECITMNADDEDIPDTAYRPAICVPAVERKLHVRLVEDIDLSDLVKPEYVSPIEVSPFEPGIIEPGIIEPYPDEPTPIVPKEPIPSEKFKICVGTFDPIPLFYVDLDGQGHKITFTDSEKSCAFASQLFSQVGYSTIRNLNLNYNLYANTSISSKHAPNGYLTRIIHNSILDKINVNGNVDYVKPKDGNIAILATNSVSNKLTDISYQGDITNTGTYINGYFTYLDSTYINNLKSEISNYNCNQSDNSECTVIGYTAYSTSSYVPSMPSILSQVSTHIKSVHTKNYFNGMTAFLQNLYIKDTSTTIDNILYDEKSSADNIEIYLGGVSNLEYNDGFNANFNKYLDLYINRFITYIDNVNITLGTASLKNNVLLVGLSKYANIYGKKLTIDVNKVENASVFGGVSEQAHHLPSEITVQSIGEDASISNVDLIVGIAGTLYSDISKANVSFNHIEGQNFIGIASYTDGSTNIIDTNVSVNHANLNKSFLGVSDGIDGNLENVSVVVKEFENPDAEVYGAANEANASVNGLAVNLGTINANTVIGVANSINGKLNQVSVKAKTLNAQNAIAGLGIDIYSPSIANLTVDLDQVNTASVFGISEYLADGKIENAKFIFGNITGDEIHLIANDTSGSHLSNLRMTAKQILATTTANAINLAEEGTEINNAAFEIDRMQANDTTIIARTDKNTSFNNIAVRADIYGQKYLAGLGEEIYGSLKNVFIDTNLYRFSEIDEKTGLASDAKPEIEHYVIANTLDGGDPPAAVEGVFWYKHVKDSFAFMDDELESAFTAIDASDKIKDLVALLNEQAGATLWTTRDLKIGTTTYEIPWLLDLL